jgi:hypothetical protein
MQSIRGHATLTTRRLLSGRWELGKDATDMFGSAPRVAEVRQDGGPVDRLPLLRAAAVSARATIK